MDFEIFDFLHDLKLMWTAFSQVYASEISRDKEGGSVPYLFRWEYSF